MYGPGGPGGPPGGGRGGGGFMKGPNIANQRPPLLEIPPNLRMMFEPRVPVEFKPPIEHKEAPAYTGIGQLASLFETTPPPPHAPFLPPAERKAEARAKLDASHAEKNELLASDWDPHHNEKATENAYFTLFVGRLSYETNEKKLRREFEQYGTIKGLRLVADPAGKPRGYAFIQFDSEAEMTNAFRKADGKKIDGRRIVCDVERGRTVRNWRPTRLGGGIGGRAAVKSKKQIKDELDAKRIASNGSAGPSPYQGPPRAAFDRGGGGGGGGGGGDRPRSEGRGRRDRSRSRDRDTAARDQFRDRERGGASSLRDARPAPRRESSRDRDSGRYGSAPAQYQYPAQQSQPPRQQQGLGYSGYVQQPQGGYGGASVYSSSANTGYGGAHHHRDQQQQQQGRGGGDRDRDRDGRGDRDRDRDRERDRDRGERRGYSRERR